MFNLRKTIKSAFIEIEISRINIFTLFSGEG